MLNKNDPLISAVQEVMKKNHTEREAVKLVNEKFGVHDRKALPHERQHEWDAAYKTVLTEGVKALDEKLVGNQHKIDANKNGRVDGGDFPLLKKGVRPVAEEENIDEAGMMPKNRFIAKIVAGSRARKASSEKDFADKYFSPLHPVGKDIIKNATKRAETKKKVLKRLEENSGFNSRHSLSEKASAEKQAVAALNEDDIDSYENRMTAGLGQQYTPYGGGRFGGGAAKTGSIRPRPVRIDNPRLKNTRTGEVSTGTSGPKTRKRLVRKQQQPSAATKDTMQGQIAKMRQQSGDVAPVRMGMNAADKAKLRIDQAKRSYRTTVQNRPPSQTPSQNIPKPNPPGPGSALPKPTNTSPVIRRGGLSTSRIIKNVAGSAAAGAAVGGAGIAAMSYLKDLGNKPPPAEAKPKKKLYTDRVPEEQPKAPSQEPPKVSTGAAPTPYKAPTSYTAQKGDTVWDIAKRDIQAKRAQSVAAVPDAGQGEISRARAMGVSNKDIANRTNQILKTNQMTQQSARKMQIGKTINTGQ